MYIHTYTTIYEGIASFILCLVKLGIFPVAIGIKAGI